MQPGEVSFDVRTCACEDLRILFIDPGVMSSAARELGFAHTPRFRTTASVSESLHAAVIALCGTVEERAPAVEQQSQLATCLRRLLELMATTHPSTRSANPAVARAKDYLRQRFHETVTLDHLARVARLSRYHLLRSFAAQVGLPPHAYQMRLRIERAMALLRSGLAANAVAGITGFADQSHMTRQFRRLVRVTPADYARAAVGR
jgi:AraC-like DNA-binding protein